MAFPTTGVLDDFNRADEFPLSGGGNWERINSGAGALWLTGNQLENWGAEQTGAWTPAVGNDQEAYITVATVPADDSAVSIWLRVGGADTATYDGYRCDFFKRAATDDSRIVRFDNGSGTILTSFVNAEYAAGDKVGASMVGTTITTYLFTGGSWSQVDTFTDATYASGQIGVSSSGATPGRQDDFGGGTVVAGREYKRFFGPALLSNAAADLYTVPAGKRARVLNIHASNPTASPVDLTLSIGTDATGTRVYDDFRVPADSIQSNYDPYDMAAGEKIQGLADTNAVMNLTITGYEDPA